MTALALAKRDLLGFPTPLWKMLAPSVVIHGMANYRGMKVRCYLYFIGFIIGFVLTGALLWIRSPFSSGTPPRLGPKCNCIR